EDGEDDDDAPASEGPTADDGTTSTTSGPDGTTSTSRTTSTTDASTSSTTGTDTDTTDTSTEVTAVTPVEEGDDIVFAGPRHRWVIGRPGARGHGVLVETLPPRSPIEAGARTCSRSSDAVARQSTWCARNSCVRVHASAAASGTKSGR